MRVLFLVNGIDEVSARFRVHQLLPHLERRGIHAEVRDLRVPQRTRWETIRAARAFDVTVVHRAFLGPVEVALLCRGAGRWLYDFDDAVMYRDSAGRGFSSWQRRMRFARMAQRAGAIIAGNRYLAELAERNNRHVAVLPTVVDPAEYRMREPASPPRPVIGWIGTRINLMYLPAVAPALVRIARERPGVMLNVVSDGVFDLPGIKVVSQPWTRAGEAADLARFHVGIMPLPDDPWTRGKCGLKILQYFAAGVPVVCSPVGVNREIVTHGTNGFLASNEEEWVARIGELLDDANLWARFALAGRETVRTRYSVDAILDRLVELLSECAT